MSWALSVDDRGAFPNGWGPVEEHSGLRFRWLVGPEGAITVRAERPWRRLLMHCRFADVVRQDVTVTVRPEPRAPAVAAGVLWWKGVGMRHRRVLLNATVPAGPAVVEFEPVQTWDERPGGRPLSIAIASVRGDARSHTRRSARVPER